MRLARWSPYLLLVLVFGVAMVLRVVLPWHGVFTADGVAFTGNDAYYHMRMVQQFVANFPQYPQSDALLAYPGDPVTVLPSFLPWLTGMVAWLVGLGHPSDALANVVGAWMPAILGSLTVIPAFFIGKALWGRHGVWAGLIGAALVAVLPGEFLGRSILGFTDQHVLEVLASVTSVLFLILAVKAGRQGRPFSLKPILFAVLSGLFLGLYIFTWMSAMLVMFAFAVYFVIQFIADHLRGQDTLYLGVVGVAVFGTAILFVPVAQGTMYGVITLAGMLIPAGLAGLSRLLVKRPGWLFPVAIVGAAGVFIGALAIVQPNLLRLIGGTFAMLVPTGEMLTTIEAQSIFTPVQAGGTFLESPAWLNFYLTLPVALLGLVILGVQVARRGNPEKTAFVVWTLVILVAAASQRRFAYYLAVNVAVLAGYVCILGYYIVKWLVDYTAGVKLVGFTRSALNLDDAPPPLPTSLRGTPSNKKARRRLQKQLAAQRRGRDTGNVLFRKGMSIGLAGILVLFAIFGQIVIFPDKAHGMTKAPAILTASSTPYAPGAAWQKSLAWMRGNTLVSAYSVAAWWDYGYWITYIAHRAPYVNPAQDPMRIKVMANLLLSQNETEAAPLITEMQARYVMLDAPLVTNKLWAVATWAGQDPGDYIQVYYDPKAKQQRMFLTPAYYRSMAARLYFFDGRAQAGGAAIVVSYVERTNVLGQSFREMTGARQFASYEEAQAWAAQNPGSVVVGADPLVSPVPLEALTGYRLVHASAEQTGVSSSGSAPEIKVFEVMR